MQKKIGLLAIGLIMAIGGALLPGCFKDKIVKTYTIYTPVYTLKSTALASLNGNSGQAISRTGQIYTKGSFIYLSDVNSGIHIIDNSDPAHPVQTAFLNIPGNQNIAIRGNILYADLYGDLLAIDISDPKHARITDTLMNVFPWRYYGQGTQNVITGWIKKDTSMASNTAESQQLYPVPGTIFYTSSLDLVSAAANATASPTGTAGSTAAMTLIGDYLYLIAGSHALGVVKLIDSSRLTLASTNMMAGYDLETIFPLRNRLLLGSKEGVSVFSIDNAAQPVKVSEFTHGTACDPVIADQDNAYVTLRSGTNCGGAANELDVLDAKDLSQVSLLKTYPMTGPTGLGKDGSLLFVCDGPAVKVFDASDPSNLKTLTTIPVSNAYDVIASNHLLLVVSATGLDQFDYSDPAHIVSLSHLPVNQTQP